MNKSNLSLEEKLEWLNRECPLTPHTGIGRLFTTVRRMKTEKELEVPINLRTGFAVSVATGKHANEMEDAEWEEFYSALSEQLKHDHLDMWERLFGV